MFPARGRLCATFSVFLRDMLRQGLVGLSRICLARPWSITIDRLLRADPELNRQSDFRAKNRSETRSKMWFSCHFFEFVQWLRSHNRQLQYINSSLGWIFFYSEMRRTDPSAFSPASKWKHHKTRKSKELIRAEVLVMVIMKRLVQTRLIERV